MAVERTSQRGMGWGHTDGLVEQSITDLRDALEELAYLIRDAEAKVDRLGTRLDRDRDNLRTDTRRLLRAQAAKERARYRELGQTLLRLRQRASVTNADLHALIAELERGRAALADLLRSQRALTAALMVAADWQSPSFMHSTVPAAGSQSGLITAHWNDYKRDRHLDAEAFERTYVAEMVEGPSDLCALLTSCGMAAFTTILDFLLFEGRLDGSVLIGRGVYHESKQLLLRALGERAHEVDEGDTRSLIAAVRTLDPSAIFLDSLGNTRRAEVPDVEAVLAELDPRAFLVVDNTGMACGFQPFALMTPTTARLIVFESLLKYAQLGLDRASAGVIVARAGIAKSLGRYREHLGTNVSDSAAHALPTPCRAVLERRLRRIERNAALIAHRLEATAGIQLSGPIEGVFYPGLERHPDHATARRRGFCGGCVSIAFRPEVGFLPQRRLVAAAIAAARDRQAGLLAGSSFGFDVTRIYLTSARAEDEPFVRVAAGAEHRLAAEAIGESVAAALRSAMASTGCRPADARERAAA